MDIGIILGIVTGVAAILGGFILEGGDPANLVAEISPFIIVLGGTAGATILTFPLEDLRKVPGVIKKLLFNKRTDAAGIINHITDLSERARKGGILSLEQDFLEGGNEFVNKGLALVVDGMETEAVKDIMEREIRLNESIDESVAGIFEAAGGFSPTMGVLGTVMGMIHVLGSMDADPGGLGKKIALAFLATLFGVGFANLFFLPVAGRIKARAEGEKVIKDLIIEGLISIQAGENPRILKEKLNLNLIEKLAGKSSRRSKTKAEINIWPR